MYIVVNIASATEQEDDEKGSFLADPRIWGKDYASFVDFGNSLCLSRGRSVQLKC